MKKLINCFLLISLAVSLFAETLFTDRIVEVKVDIPAGFSNNTLGIFDYLKDEVLIDLTEFADEMPDDGLMFAVHANPNISLTIDLPVGPLIKTDVGLNAYSNIGISKDIFDYLGHGNEDDLYIDEKINGYFDLFAYLEAETGWSSKKFDFRVSTSVFTALLHASIDDSSIIGYNNDDGKFGYKINGNANVYSMVPFNLSMFSLDYLKNYQDYLWKFINLKSLGWDASASVTINPTKYLTLTGTLNCPIIPCQLSVVTPVKCMSEYEIGVTDFFGESSLAAPSFNYEVGTAGDGNYVINRPLKFNLSGNFHPHNGIMDDYFMFGFGIQHPFAKNISDVDFYFDYLIGLRIGLWHLVNLDLSTERIDLVYKHKVQATVNLRFFQFCVGVATESTDFAKSFRGSGIGAYANVAIGL